MPTLALHVAAQRIILDLRPTNRTHFNHVLDTDTPNYGTHIYTHILSNIHMYICTLKLSSTGALGRSTAVVATMGNSGKNMVINYFFKVAPEFAKRSVGEQEISPKTASRSVDQPAERSVKQTFCHNAHIQL